jgi:hypothetical protein
MTVRVEEEKGGNYIQGVGNVQKTPGGVMVTMFPGEQKEVTYNNVDLGSVVLPDSFQTGQYSVRLSGDGKTLYSIRPLNGSFVMVFDRFAAQKDMPPQPKFEQGGQQRKRADGGTFISKDKLTCTAIFKVVSKKYLGMEIPYKMDYTFDFTTYKDEKVVRVPYGKVYLNKTYDFLVVCGWNPAVDDLPFPPDANLLPYLEELFRNRKVKVQATIKNGWIDGESLVRFDPENLE